MKTVAALLVVAVGLFAAQAHAATKLKSPGSAAKASATDCWWRMPKGAWVRVPAQDNSPAAAPQAPMQRRTSNASSLRAKFDFRPNRVGDIDWYLNGRGAFSD